MIDDPINYLTMNTADLSPPGLILDQGSAAPGYWATVATGSPSSVAGKIAEAQPFNYGSDYYNYMYNAVVFDYSQGTIAYWCKPVTAYNSGLRTFTGFNTDGGIEIQQYWDGNFYVRAGESDRLIFAMDSTNWPLDDWVHHIFSWGAAGKKFYVNGSVWSYSSFTPAGSYTGNFFAGSREVGNNPFFGDLDEYRIYGRQLSDADAAELYAYTGGGPPPSGSPLLLKRRKMEAA